MQGARRAFAGGLAGGLCHGVLMALAFAPVGLWGAALLATAPLALVAWKAKRARWAGLGACVGVSAWWWWSHRWIWDVSAAGLPVLVAYLSLYAGLFVVMGVMWRRVVERKGWGAWRFWWALPVVWCGLEMFRGSVMWDGYAWFFVGHPLIDAQWGAGLGSMVGAIGASLVVAAMGVWVVWVGAAAREKRHRRGAVVMLALLVAVMGVGWMAGSRARIGERERLNFDLGLVQTNVPQSNKVSWGIEQRLADFARMEALTREAKAKGAEVIVWPETMFPGLALNAEAVEAEREAGLRYAGGIDSTVFYDRLLALQEEVGVPLIVGAISMEGVRIKDDEGGIRVERDATYNSVFVVDGPDFDEAPHMDVPILRRHRYDKIRLTPFGEYMPYISKWKWLEKRLLALGASGMSFDLEAGSPSFRLEADLGDGRKSLSIYTPVCFEISEADLCRRMALGGVDGLINVTNDGWFGNAAGGRENHMMLARWRAAENWTWVARAANTGISCFIDRWGRVVAKMGANEEGVLVVEQRAPWDMRPLLIYPQVGDSVGWVCLAGTGLLAVGSVIGRERKGRVADSKG